MVINQQLPGVINYGGNQERGMGEKKKEGRGLWIEVNFKRVDRAMVYGLVVI